MHYLYIIKSVKPRKHRYYIGVSSLLIYRILQHNSPLNTGYTRNCKWKLVYVEAYQNKATVYDREKKLKQYGNVWNGVMKRIKESIG